MTSSHVGLPATTLPFIRHSGTPPSGEFVANSMVFAASAEARTYGADLGRRWSLVRQWEVRPSEDPVNSEIKDGAVRRVESLTRR